jgi:hypothetical protein
MFKNKLYAKFETLFQDYLFNFEEKNLHTSILSGNVNMKDVNIRPDKINEIFKKKNLPIALKAGLISKLNVKVITQTIFIDHFFSSTYSVCSQTPSRSQWKMCCSLWALPTYTCLAKR